MDLRNKTTSQFRTVFDSPLGAPNSQFPLYMYMSNIEGDRNPYLTASQYKGLHGIEKDKSLRKPEEGEGGSQ